jgi:hypothetical protein
MPPARRNSLKAGDDMDFDLENCGFRAPGVAERGKVGPRAPDIPATALWAPFLEPAWSLIS